MGIWFAGDLDYKCPSYLDPTEFGCHSCQYEHFVVYDNEIDKVNSGIQKYKDLLKPYGVNASDINMDILLNMRLEDIQQRWNLKEEDALKVDEYLYTYCIGCEILSNIKENGLCHFYIPA